MRTTLTLAANVNCDPFRVMDADADEVIMVINYYIQSADEAPRQQQTTAGGPRRVRVTNATATGGWF